MFLARTNHTYKGQKRPYLYAVQGYREDGKNKTKTIKSFGYLDKLEKEHLDPIAYCKEEMEKLKKQYAQENGENVIRFRRNEVLEMEENNSKNIGYTALSLIYHELGLNRFYANRDKERKQYSLNQAMKLLVYSRILNPCSKRKTTIDKDFFFEKFDLSKDDIYRSLKRIEKYKDDLQKHLNEKIKNLYKRDSELVYYDVTNYYFEIDKPDNLRKKGVSKEHRPNPIVQMGLLMDQNSLPIAFDLYPGNTNDCQTLMPSLAKSRADFGLKKIIIVADKGLDSSENIIATVANGDGYIFSGSIRKATKGMKRWVLDDKGYKDQNDDRKYKSGLFIRKIRIPRDDKKIVYEEIEERRIVIYSEKYARKAQRDREQSVQKARKIVSNKQNYERLLDKTAAKYIKNIEYNENTGEIIKKGKGIYFDEEKLEEERKYDGYYMLTTSEMNKTDIEIMNIYSGLWEIEESFKITKSELKTRPVYLQKEENITAHFVTCFISLLIIRILELKLKKKYSPHRLIESMRRANTVYEGDGWYLSTYHDEIIGKFASDLGINLTRKRNRKNELNSIINKTKTW